MKSCHSCATVKTPPIIRRGIGSRFSKVWRPLQRIVLDFVGPIIPTYKGNKVLLVITDEFTKFAESIPLPNMQTPVLAEALVDRYFTKYGFCDLAVSDRGPSFRSKLMKDIAKICQIKWVHGAPYHPQSQGTCERYNRMLVSMLTHYCQEDPKEWDTYTSFVTNAYNTSVHATTLYTPYELMFGRQPVLPVDALTKGPERSYSTARDYRAF